MILKIWSGRVRVLLKVIGYQVTVKTLEVALLSVEAKNGFCTTGIVF